MKRGGGKDSQRAQIESVPQAKASLSKRNNDEMIMMKAILDIFSTEGKR